jgi:hypothetical protein
MADKSRFEYDKQQAIATRDRLLFGYRSIALGQHAR